MVVARPLTRELIVDEAIALLEEEGPQALSMRRLATRLGSGTMSTYHHVPDKGALVEAIADRLMAELDQPSDDEPWDAALRSLAVSFRRLARRNRSAFKVLLSGPRPSAMLRTTDQVVSRLESAGFPHDRAVVVVRTLIRYLLGTALVEAGRTGGVRGSEPTFEAGLDLLLTGARAEMAR